jgi:transcriptional repressor NrdR
MRCPFCGELRDRVIDSRTLENGVAIRRRRQCEACQKRYTTYERVDELLQIVKRGGYKELYDRQKVINGIRAASKNRPVTVDEISNIVDEIEDALRDIGQEIPSETIGKLVLDHLREVDEVAYVRFASVYKGFENAGDFQKEVHLLTKLTEPKKRK